MVYIVVEDSSSCNNENYKRMKVFENKEDAIKYCNGIIFLHILEKEVEVNKWSKTFPEEEGLYWFYGYRYGKVSCGKKCEPEFMLVTVHKTGNDCLMYVASGQFIYESEVEEPHFKKAEYPEPPQDMQEEIDG